jgi:hypothetical protein
MIRPFLLSDIYWDLPAENRGALDRWLPKGNFSLVRDEVFIALKHMFDENKPNRDIIVGTNNVERMRVTSGGDIQMGMIQTVVEEQ